MRLSLVEFLAKEPVDDVPFEEDSPKYLCAWNTVHVTNMTKCLIIMYLFEYAVLISFRLTFSVVCIPIILLVFVPAIYAVKNEKYVFLFPLISFLALCSAFCVVLCLAVFSVGVIDYDLLVFSVAKIEIQSTAGKVGFLLFVKIFTVAVTSSMFWQVYVVYACRQFYYDKCMRNRFMRDRITGSLLPVHCPGAYRYTSFS